jgi:uncharacterized pyridoxal phosphate-containing UPF0001 family protein
MTERREELAANLAKVREKIAPFDPMLIVVTKTYPVSDVEILRELGENNFGENRSSEGLEKSAVVPAHWHYQGEIQSKKIREILKWAECIHSLDKFDHAQKISNIASESGKTVDLFIQLSPLASLVAALPFINLIGIMSVPPVALNVDAAFATIGQIHKRFVAKFPESPYLSAGMSGDYMTALANGATHIRVGSKILGSRQYP